MRLFLSIESFEKARIIYVCTFRIIIGYSEDSPPPAAIEFYPDGPPIVTVLDGIINEK